MHVLAIVFGLLLIMFGGGCTLIFLFAALSDPASLFNDIGMYLVIWLPLGLLPLAGGLPLFRWGLKADRAKRQAAAQAAAAPTPSPEPGPK